MNIIEVLNQWLRHTLLQEIPHPHQACLTTIHGYSLDP